MARASGIRVGIDVLYPGPSNNSSISELEKLVDIVAVHGLGADPETTWVARVQNKAKADILANVVPKNNQLGIKKGSWLPSRAIHWLRETFDEVASLESTIEFHATANADEHTKSDIGSEKVNWLKDVHMLPHAVPHTRILSFAYESQWLGKDSLNQRLPLVAQQLLRSLMEQRKDYPSRPLIFIGHCFGGIVIEKALVDAKLNPEDYPGIVTSTTGVIFLGTPHRGSQSHPKAELIATIASAAGLGEKSSLLRTLQPDSEALNDLLYDFSRVVNIASIPLFCFFEQHKSAVAKAIVPRLVRPFIPDYQEFIVNETSSCIDGFPKLALASDHFRMNKFASPEDSNYRFVSQEIVQLVSKAPERIIRRSERLPIIQNDIRLKEELNRECLRDLFVTNSRDDMDLILATQDELLENTGDWLLRDPLFTEWLHESPSQILWLHGGPGKGKTMLAISTVQALSEKIELNGSTKYDALAYFFCKDTDDRRNTALAILRTIIYQVLCQHPKLLDPLQDEYEWQGGGLFSPPNALQALWRILRKILKKPELQNVYILVDALDECNEESLTHFLSLLEPYINSRWPNANDSPFRKVKWMLTSRDKRMISQSLLGALDISLESNSPAVTMAVQRYIYVKTDDLARIKGYKEDLISFVRETLREKAEDTFLWVALACHVLRSPDVTRINTKSVLQQLPQGLVSFYGRMMKQVLGIRRPEIATFVREILRSVVFAFRPLELSELAVLADLPLDYRQDHDELEALAMHCGSFLKIRERTLYLVHQSAKDFLLSPEGIAKCFSQSGIEHDLFTIRCFKYICTAFKEPDFSTALSSIKEENHLPLEYPSYYWVDHGKVASDRVAEDFNVDNEFFQRGSKLRQAWFKVYLARSGSHLPENVTSLHLAAHAGLSWLVLELLRKGDHVSDVRAADSTGEEPLNWAARNGHDKVVQLLLEHGAGVDATDGKGRTALSWAAGNGHEAVVKLLLDHKTDVDAKDEGGWTALHWAATKGHKMVVQLLLENKADLEAADKTGVTALMLAAHHGQLTTIAVLLEKGADIEAEDKYGTALIRASKGGHEAVAVLLLEKGAKSSVLDRICGKTALHWAAERGHKNISELLVLHGGFLNAPDAFGETALHYAAGNGHELVVEALLRSRPNVLLQDKKGRTPRGYAEQKGHTNVARILKEYSGDVLDLHTTEKGGRTELIEAARRGQKTKVWQLVEKGANLEAKDEYGSTALITAASGGHEMTVKLLIEKGAEIEAKDIYGKTALMYAAQGHMAALQLLLEKGAEVRATDDDGQTALHWAARYGHEVIVGLLLERGAVLDATSRDGTALSWAANGGHDGVVSLLLKNHANIEVKGGGSFGGGTPLSLAAAWGHESTVLQLLQSGAELDAKGEYEQTALERAREGGHKATVKILEGWSEHRRA